MWDAVDRGDGVPVHVAREANQWHARLRQRLPDTFAFGVAGKLRVALKVVVAGLVMAGYWHMADHQRWLVCGLKGARQPKQINLRQVEATPFRLAHDLCIGAPERNLPITRIQYLVLQGLAKDIFVLCHAQMIAVVVAANVIHRQLDGAESLYHLAFQPQICLFINIRNPVAQIEHHVRSLGVHPIGKARHQAKGYIAALRVGGRTMVNVSNNRNAQGHEWYS